MSKLRRHSRGFLSNLFHSKRKRRRTRRQLQGEQLERRELLAFNLFASDGALLHNNLVSTDVTNDGFRAPDDVLGVINAMNAPVSASEQSSEDAADMFVDTDGDGYLSPNDALRVINDLNENGAGENGDVIRISALALASNAFNDDEIEFNDNGSSDTIVRTDSGSWVNDGFSAGDMILVSDANLFFDVDLDLCDDFHGGPGTCEFFNDPNNPDNPANGQPIIGERVNPDTGELEPVTGDFDPDRNTSANGMYTIASVTDSTITLDSNAALPNLDEYEEEPFVYRILTSLGVGQEFQLGIAGEDLRTMDDVGNPLPPHAVGPFAIFSNVNYVPQEFTVNARSVANAEFHNHIESRTQGNFSTPGTVNGIGSVNLGDSPGFSPLGAGKHLAQTFPMEANITGDDFQVTLSFATPLPQKAVLVNQGSGPVPESMIDFVPLVIDVVSDISADDDSGITVDEDSSNNNINVLSNDEVLNPPDTDPVITQVNGASVSQGQTVSVNDGQVNVVSLTSKNGTNFSFTPTSGFSGDTSFTYTISNGAGATDTATVSITVTPDQDPPVADAGNGLNIDEDPGAPVSLTGVSVSDGDGDDLSVDLSVNNGTLAVTGSGSISSMSGSSFSIDGSLTDLNATLSTLTYNPNANFGGSDTFSITATDPFVSDTDTATITINPINDAPVNTVPGPQTVFNTDTLAFSGGVFSVDDVDASNLEVNLTVGQGTVSFGSTAGLQVSGNNSASLTATGSISNLNNGLNSLTYDPLDTFTGLDTLTMTTSDLGATGAGGPMTDIDSVNIQVTPPTTPFAATDFFEIEEDPLSDLAFNASDLLSNDLAPDPDPDPNTLSLTMINGQDPASGPFSTTQSGSLTFDPGTGSFTYSPQAEFFGLDTFTYTIESLPDAGDGPSTGTVEINVQPINDGPVNSVPGSLSVDEDNPLPITNGNTIEVQDIDAGTSGLTVTLTVGNGTLNVSSTGGVQGNNSNQVTISGTVSQVNNTLDGLTYTPQTNFFGSDQLSVSTNDNGNTGGVRGNPSANNPLSDLDTVDITVQPINDAPVIVVPGSQSFFTDFDNRFSSDPNPFQISDVDAGNNDVQVDLTIGDGALTIGNTSGVTVTQNPDGNNGIRVTGTVTSINNALATGVDYNTSVDGNKTLTATVNDLGNTGGGGQQTDTATVDVEVLDFVPIDIQGQIFGDVNGNGQKDRNDHGIEGVDVRLSGTDFRGSPVNLTVRTNQNGEYVFRDLRPNGAQPYTITQLQPMFLENGHQSVDQATVTLDTQGNVNVNGTLNFTEGSFTPGFVDPFDIFALSGERPFNSGISIGVNGQQEWAIFFGDGWDMNRYSNARFAPSTDGFSGILTVFDAQTGQDRTAAVSTQAGTLTFRGDGSGRIYRIVGDSSLLSSNASAEGEASSSDESGDATTNAAAFARGVDALFAGS